MERDAPGASRKNYRRRRYKRTYFILRKLFGAVIFGPLVWAAPASVWCFLKRRRPRKGTMPFFYARSAAGNSTAGRFDSVMIDGINASAAYQLPPPNPQCAHGCGASPDRLTY